MEAKQKYIDGDVDYTTMDLRRTIHRLSANCYFIKDIITVIYGMKLRSSSSKHKEDNTNQDIQNQVMEQDLNYLGE